MKPKLILEPHKAYKTRAGHKAIVVWKESNGTFTVWHSDTGELLLTDRMVYAPVQKVIRTSSLNGQNLRAGLCR